MHPSQSTLEPKKEVSLEQVRQAGDECLKRADEWAKIKQQSQRLERQLATIQSTIFHADQAVKEANKALSAALGGDTEGDMAEMVRLKAALDDAQMRLDVARRERTIIREAQKANALKLAEADKGLTLGITAVKELAQDCFKTTWSRSRMWVSHSEKEFDWRQALLGVILASLTARDLANTLRILYVFLEGRKFTTIVQRGFIHVGPTSDDRKQFTRGQEVVIPSGLPYRTAFEEVLGGRLGLAEA